MTTIQNLLKNLVKIKTQDDCEKARWTIETEYMARKIDWRDRASLLGLIDTIEKNI